MGRGAGALALVRAPRHAADPAAPVLLCALCRLFDSDNDLNQGVFAETVRQQHLNEQLLFYQGIEDVILDQVEKNNSDSCTPAILSYAFRKVRGGGRRGRLARLAGAPGRCSR